MDIASNLGTTTEDKEEVKARKMEISRHMIQSGKWDMEYKCAYLCTKQWEENLD
jgi:hypothetical protein